MSVTAKTLINSKYGSSVGAAEYTVPAKTSAIIDKFTATNSDTGAVTISISLVPSGQAPTDSCKIIRSLSVAAGATAIVSEIMNHILSTGDSVFITVSAANKMVIRMSGREIS